MLSLTDPLVSSITIDGRAYPIKTDFRTWLRLGSGQIEPEDIFVSDIPDMSSAIVGILEFMAGPLEEGSQEPETGAQLIDYEIDSECIFAGFLQAYGVDLTVTDLHWHKFVALLKALPEETILSKIISYRSYEGDDEEMNKLKRLYSLPVKLTEAEKEAGDYFEEVFGGD